MNEVAGRRTGVLAFVSIALLIVLVSRLWFLQVMTAPEYQQTATANRTRDIYIESPRGRILDAQGRVLAGRRESLVVTLDWTQLRDLDEAERDDVFGDVAAELNLAGLKTKQADLVATYERARNGSLKPVVVAEDVDDATWVSFSERTFTGFDVERRWVRTYPYGEIGAHIIGYTRTVASQELADELNVGNPLQFYLPGDELGATGVERLFETTLRGVPEKRRVEIDAQNRIIRTAEILQEGVPGQDIVLSIDIDLQWTAEQILAEELADARAREACDTCDYAHVAQAGSLVALDVNDGSVVALASVPNYDPSDFIFGISSDQFAFLRDRPDQPLFDRSIRGLYPAGSTFKPITAYAALTSGLRTEWEIWEDEGVYLIEDCTAGCRFQNAGAAVMGPVDMREALERSSDTYFFAIGDEFWQNTGSYGETPIQDVARDFGLGEATGILLPDEAVGRVPDAENRIEEFGTGSRPWTTGDNINLSIGQGDLLVSPLQLANLYAMLATGGTRYQPRIVDVALDGETGEVTNEFRVIVAHDERLDPTALNAIRDGLFRVPRTGTGQEAFAGFPLDQFPIAGKTGTAEVANKADFALFAGFGPGLTPEYSVAAVLEEAGFGGDAAAPAVRRLFEYLLGIRETPAAPLAGEEAPSLEPEPETETEGDGDSSGESGSDSDGTAADGSDAGAEP